MRTIAENPDAWIGGQVIASGDVNEILTPNAYVPGGEAFVDGGELLVVDPPLLPGEIETLEDEVLPQDIVQITGAE